MTDQCKHCELKGNIEGCLNEDCLQHDSWYAQEQQGKINELQDFAIWLTGCGYDFTQHKYFCEQRDKLLLGYKHGESEEIDQPISKR